MSATTDLEALLDKYLASGGKITDLIGDKVTNAAPKTDDELWDWVRENCGIEIPRTSVCEGHVAPFTVLADLYFRRTTATVIIANRGGGKTSGVALLHYVNGRTRKNIESLSFGATQAQADRCYNHLRKLVGPEQKYVREIRAQKTIFDSGCETETVAGSEKAVNGPHPNIAHADEVEQMDPKVFSESRGMALSSIVDGEVVPSQDIITSTRKRGTGPMQSLIDEVTDARLRGDIPPYDVYTYCIFEVAAQVPNCQVALPKLKGDEKCQCDRIVKGVWEETGEKRTLRDCCKGRLYRSRGFFPFHDVRKKFLDNTRAVWEAQHTCEKPSLEGMVYPMFARERHCITGFEPDPANGTIYSGHDFGGSHPFAAVYMQKLKFAVDATGYGGEPLQIPEGAMVVFSEIYKADIGMLAYVRMLKSHEGLWRRKFPGWRVGVRFADPQGKSHREDMYEEGMGCSWWGASRIIQEGIPKVAEKLDDNLLFFDINRAPITVDEIETYHYPPKKPGFVDDPDEPVDDFNHAIDALRYVCVNVSKREIRGDRKVAAPQMGPARYVLNDGQPVRAASSPIGIVGGMPAGEEWRGKFTGVAPPTRKDDEPWRA